MQLGNDLGNSVTLGGANTYTGGTSILAGNLIIAGDSSLGAASSGRRDHRSQQHQGQRPGRQRHHLQQPERRQRHADDRDHGRKRRLDVLDRAADRRRRRSRHHQSQRLHRDADRPAGVAGIERYRPRQRHRRIRPDDRRHRRQQGRLDPLDGKPEFLRQSHHRQCQVADGARHERRGARQHVRRGGIDRTGRSERRHIAGRRIVCGARTQPVPRQRQQLRRQWLHHQLGQPDRCSAHPGRPQQQHHDGRRGHLQQPHHRRHRHAAIGRRRGGRNGHVDQRHHPSARRDAGDPAVDLGFARHRHRKAVRADLGQHQRHRLALDRDQQRGREQRGSL